MSNKVRASLGFDDEDDAPSPAEALKAFDPKSFEAPKPRPSNDRPDRDAIRKAGEEAGFKSREGGKPAAAAAPKPTRQRRNFTGRSEQINIRATADFKARFQAVVAKAFPSDVVAMEKAIELLEEHFRRSK